MSSGEVLVALTPRLAAPVRWAWCSGRSRCGAPPTATEAVLKLRALLSNDDFDNYWDYHLTQEKHRIHEGSYQNGRNPSSLIFTLRSAAPKSKPYVLSAPAVNFELRQIARA